MGGKSATITDDVLKELQRKNSRSRIYPEQINFNKNQPFKKITNAKNNVFYKKDIVAVDSYGLSSLGIGDQLMMALDGVGLAELKASLAPIPIKNIRDDSVYNDWEGILFAAAFDLNDGDPLAMRTLIKNFSTVYEHFLYRVEPRSFYGFSFEENSMFRSIGSAWEPTSTKTEDALREALPNMMCDVHFICSKNNRISLTFDLIDINAPFSKDKNKPSLFGVFSSRVNVDKDDSRNDATWSYYVCVASADGTVPGDNLLRLEHESYKAITRASLADLGVHPQLKQ